MGTWQGKVTGITESVPSNVHAPLEMDRINRYFKAENLDTAPYGNSTPFIDTITTFHSGKLALKSDSGVKSLKWTAPSLSYDITIEFPSSLVSADGTVKSVFDSTINIFTVAQKFDKEIKLKPITTPANDATYVSLYVDSADSRLKYKKTDNAIVIVPSGVGGASGNIQYNDGSNGLAAEAALTYDAANNELTVPGIDVQEDLKISAVLSPAQITGNQNNYNPTDLDKKTVIRLDVNAERIITGIVPTANNRILKLVNISSYKIYLSKEDAGSTAANRFDFIKDIVILPKNSVEIFYDPTASRWKLLASTTPQIHILDKTTVNTTVSNSLTETSIHSVTIPANYLNNNGIIRVTIYGEYLNNSGGNADFKLNIEYNAVSMWRDQAVAVGTSTSKRAVVFEFILAPDNNGASAQVVFGKAIMSDAGGALAGFGDWIDDEIMAVTSFGGNASETTTTDKTLNILVQHSVQNANISFTKKLALIEYIP